METLLEIKNLSVTFNNTVKAVKNLSYSLKKGGALSIVGESGSGKTVSSLAIVNLLGPAAQIKGGIFFEGKNTLSLSAQKTRALRGGRVAFIFQDPSAALNPLMTVYKQIEEVFLTHKTCAPSKIKKRIIELLKETGLELEETKLHCYPHEFSGGQKQRILIAMALAGEPDLLIADEPTTALDVTVQKQIISLLKYIQKKRKMSLLFITHNLALAKEMAEDILVMRNGDCVEAGRAVTVLKDPRNAYTKKLLDSVLDINDDAPVADVSGETNILEIKNLDKTFRRKTLFKTTSVHAVRGVSFNLKKSSAAALVGESGSGKSTVAKLLLNLEKPDGGEIIFNTKKRCGVQAVFQDPYASLDPRQTVKSALLEPLEIHNYPREKRLERVEYLLSAVGLGGEDMNRYPHQFSGGQRQRIAIARAIALEPEVLIADEPTSALDVSVQAQILNLLKDIKEKFNLSILFITHDLAAAKFISDSVYVMKDGVIVESGPCAQVFENPKEEYTKNLINSVPSLK